MGHSLYSRKEYETQGKTLRKDPHNHFSVKNNHGFLKTMVLGTHPQTRTKYFVVILSQHLQKLNTIFSTV